MARAAGGGLALKGLQWFCRFIELCCAALILGVFSYFIVTLHNHGLNVDNYTRSIEGISGAAVLYTLIGLLLVCFLAGMTFFSLFAILMDLAFVGAFIYVAYETRSGARSCTGTVDTIYGTGDADADNSVSTPDGGNTRLPSFKQACQLETACFSVAIAAIVFFLLSALLELALMRHHRKQSAFGPSPDNNYTSGSKSGGLFGRHKHRDEAALAAGGLAEHEKHHHDTLPVHTTPAVVRNSYNTDNTAVAAEPAYNKYGNGDGYTGTNVGYNKGEGYPTAATGTTVGARRNEYPAASTTATYDSAYRTPVTTEVRNDVSNVGSEAAYDSHYTTAGEIPAREYLQNSVHNNY